MFEVELAVVVVDILQQLLRIRDDAEGITQESDVALLDLRTVVSGVLAHRAVVEVVELEIIGHLAPAAVRSDTQALGGLARVRQRGLGCAVGKGVVVDTNGVFVGADDILYRVAAVVVALDAAKPEVGTFLHQREALVAQPVYVAGGAEVQPGAIGHAGRDVLLHRAREGVGRRRLLAVGVGLPGEHRPLVAHTLGTFVRRGQTVHTEIYHRPRQLGMQNGNHRQHPRVGVPEDMAVVALAALAHRRYAAAAAGANRAVEVVEGSRHRRLQLLVAVDGDIALPQFVPQFLVTGHQAVAPLAHGKEHLALALLPRVAVVGARAD